MVNIIFHVKFDFLYYVLEVKEKSFSLLSYHIEDNTFFIIFFPRLENVFFKPLTFQSKTNL